MVEWGFLLRALWLQSPYHSRYCTPHRSAFKSHYLDVGWIELSWEISLSCVGTRVTEVYLLVSPNWLEFLGEGKFTTWNNICVPHLQKHTVSARNRHTHLVQHENIALLWPSPLIKKRLELTAAANSWSTTCYSKIDTKVLSLFIRNETIALFLTSFARIKGAKIDGLILYWVLHHTAVMMKSGVFTKIKCGSCLQEPL